MKLFDKKWLILLLGTYGRALGTVDLYNMTFSLPYIELSLYFKYNPVWVINTFLFFYIATLIIGGKLIRTWGNKPTYNLSLTLFAAGAIISATTPDSYILLIGRALSGIGCGMITPLSRLLIHDAFGKHERGHASGIGNALFNFLIIVSPLICAALAQYINWRLIFWSYLPIALMLYLLSIPLVSNYEKFKEQFSYIGASLFTFFIFFLLFTFMEGHTFGWSSWIILGSLALSALSIATFIFVTQKSSIPLIDLELFHHKAFSLLICVRLLYVTSRYALPIWMLYFLNSLSYPAVAVSLFTLYSRAPSMISDLLGGYLCHRITYLTTLRIGLLVGTLGALLVALFYQQTKIYYFLPGILIYFFFGSFVTSSSSTMALSFLSEKHRAHGSSIISLSRFGPMAIALALFYAIFHAFPNGQFGLLWTAIMVAACQFFALLISLFIKPEHEESMY